ncbi:MAG TPA: hypothetical protein VJ782_10220 [Aeromicrobium sp.]|nr:hypothetical protein [Aeromicrobium sp.]
MNIKSYGGRMVVFLFAAAAILIAAAGLTWADTRDDLARGDRESITAAPDNDDNPDVSRSVGLDADDRPLTGSERAKIATAAAKAVGSGTVTDMEASDDFGTAYEAEVYDRAGAEWDVELDAKFAVVAKSRDS